MLLGLFLFVKGLHDLKYKTVSQATGRVSRTLYQWLD